MIFAAFAVIGLLGIVVVAQLDRISIGRWARFRLVNQLVALGASNAPGLFAAGDFHSGPRARRCIAGRRFAGRIRHCAKPRSQRHGNRLLDT